MGRLVVLAVLLLAATAVSAQDFVVIGWNDLGMHCSNKDFSRLAVLPPFNNIRVQVIRVGDSSHVPALIGTDVYVTYEIPGNTYSVGKTNFWDFDADLFGIDLPPNIGLTGVGLSGGMTAHGDYFEVVGVPLTPYTDADLVNEDPFQLGLLSLYDLSDQLLASTQAVVPVSNEMNCVHVGCHASEQAILDLHGPEAGFDPQATPILCASCHSSNALGAPGLVGVASLSEAMHKHHGEQTSDCYTCHPGPTTQCLRGVMATQHGMTCQDCHGTVTQVGESISSGREPWLEEPSCGDALCHGALYAEEPGKLFRESRGHGGLFCSACHGEPHAIAPSRVDRDNLQNEVLQGYAGTLDNCATCHGITPAGAGPHGLPADCCVGSTGNVNCDAGDGVDISDVTLLVNFLFVTFDDLCCPAEANTNGDSGGTVDISDLTRLVNHLFVTFEPLAACQ